MTDVKDLYQQVEDSFKGLNKLVVKEPLKRRRETLYDSEEEMRRAGTVAPGDQKRFVKQNHSEIEKRRRDKMNTYITELSKIIPTCMAMSKVSLVLSPITTRLNVSQKTDKLTILRLAVQHIKSIHGNLDTYTEGNYKPPMLSDLELRNLILPNCDGFMFVVDTARGRILFVSESVISSLNFSAQELTGQSLFDIIHPKDMNKIKEQLTSSDVASRDRLIDSRTLLPVQGSEMNSVMSRLHPGARRDFLCRIKYKQVLALPPYIVNCNLYPVRCQLMSRRRTQSHQVALRRRKSPRQRRNTS